MALVINNPFGEMRGSFAGGIFQYNKSGQIYRQRTTPSSRLTTRNLNNASLFRALASTYNVLSPEIKTSWNAFATDGFIPRNNYRPGTYTGKDCYMAINRHLVQMNFLKANIYCYPNGGVDVLDAPVTDWQTPISPPEVNISNTIIDTNNFYYPLEFWPYASVLSDDYSIDLQVNIVGAPGGGISGPGLINFTNHYLSFNFYFSEPLKFSGQVPKNKFNVLAASTNQIGPMNTPMSGFTLFNFRGDVSSTLANMSWQFRLGQWFLITMVLVGDNGTYTVCNSGYLNVQSA